MIALTVGRVGTPTLISRIAQSSRTRVNSSNFQNDSKLWREKGSYKWFLPIQTRWKDNDQYGHVNNAVFQSYFDSAANLYLMRHCGLNPDHSRSDGATDITFRENSNEPAIAFIAECYSQFFEPLQYPNIYAVGLSVSHLGKSSIRYRLGLFRFLQESPHSLDLIHGHFSGRKHDLAPQLNVKALACGTFVHVVVNPTTQVPTNIPSRWRENLRTLVISA